ncbi:MAG TPA: LytR C-terminal domain-containing protein [Candidatus Acidoferrales bacterium]|nr:LytR C-terminal domain-containing protein [Candidatus Acidoferrales bacterium]
MKRRKGKFLSSAKGPAVVALRVLVVFLAVVLVYSLADRFLIHPPFRSDRIEKSSPTKIEKMIQISVRNECGTKNIAMGFTSYLRKRGFDVVETTNGSIQNREVTTVVDAAGNYENATRVAEALGVRKENVVSKLDRRSYVDVEVLIGMDYQNLKPTRSIE